MKCYILARTPTEENVVYIREEDEVGKQLVAKVKRSFNNSFVLGVWRPGDSRSKFTASRTIKGREAVFTVEQFDLENGFYVVLAIEVDGEEASVSCDSDGWVCRKIFLALQEQYEDREEKLRSERERREKARRESEEKRNKKFVNKLLQSF